MARLQFVIFACLLAVAFCLPVDEVTTQASSSNRLGVPEGFSNIFRRAKNFTYGVVDKASLFGTIAKSEDFPATVTVIEGTSQLLGEFCGGVLISKNMVLTAARCFDTKNVRAGKIHVRTGGKQDFSKPQAQMIRVKNVNIHQCYNKASMDFANNLAILELENDVELNGNVKPTELYSNDLAQTNASAIVVGIGYLHAPVKIMDMEQCAQFFDVSSHDVCVAQENRNGNCVPFSGEGFPLYQVDAQGQQTTTGIMSYYNEAKCNEKPTVYTRLSVHSRWIKAIMNGQNPQMTC